MHPISRKTSLWPMHPTLLNNPIQTPWKARFPGHYLYNAILWLSLCELHPGGNSFLGAVFCKVYFAFFAKLT